MTVLVDTSALYGVVDETDPNHARLADTLRGLEDRRLVTHNYIVVESTVLVRRRLGPEPVRHLLLGLLAAIEIVWVDETIHRSSVSAFLASGRRNPSLVDLTSFEVMRTHGIHEAFAVDRDFADAGFELIP